MTAFKFVNDLEEALKVEILEAIENCIDGVRHLSETYQKIGGGACGDVYAVNERLVLKWNNGWLSGTTRDHIVLEALQGLPLVPTLYGYSEDGMFILIERIHGETISRYEFSKMFSLLSYDSEKHKKLVNEFAEGCLERGWLPNDLHGGNAMITPEGKFYVVDYGLFKEVGKATEWDYEDSGDDVRRLADWGEHILGLIKERKESYLRINLARSLDIAV
jgi:ABC1 atypical kinase-like domain